MKGDRRPLAAERAAKEEHDREQKVLKAQQVISELQSPKGTYLMKQIEAKLIGKAKKLIKADPECSALLEIVDDMNSAIKLADRSVKDMLGHAGKITRED